MSSVLSLSDRLSRDLHVNTKLRVYHISTPPEPSAALYAPGPGQVEQPTACESHFLGVTQSSDDPRDELLVLGVEVLIYTANRLTTVFVSKADSTGFLARTSPGRSAQSVAQIVITSFLHHLILPRLSSGARLVLSLFARSQDQYLFPGSVENSTKHVLDDRQLIKWWCRVLDPLLHADPSAHGLSDLKFDARGYLIVPGCDRGETKTFYPPSPTTDIKWTNRYPVDFIVDQTALPPRCSIPRFPDDPKARFLDDLDGDHVDDAGNWRSVRSLDQFWEMLSYRQECSAGRLVGFIWIVFSSPPDTLPHTAITSAEGHVTAGPISTSHAYDMKTKASASPPTTSLATDKIQAPVLVVRQGPKLVPTHDEIEVEAHERPPCEVCATQVPESTASEGYDEQAVPAEPSVEAAHSARPSVSYQALMDHLLQLDFAGKELAVQSTRSWIDRAAKLELLDGTGTQVLGTLEHATAASVTNQALTREVNVLSVVRKKRKAASNTVEHINQHNGEANEAGRDTSSLDTGLLKKKPKA